MDNALKRRYNLPLLIKFAFPNMVMMIFMSLYTIADGMFISRFVGTNALSATNIVYPITGLDLGISIMISSGGSAVIARKMGEGSTMEARCAICWEEAMYNSFLPLVTARRTSSAEILDFTSLRRIFVNLILLSVGCFIGLNT